MTDQEINEAVARKLGWTHYNLREGGVQIGLPPGMGPAAENELSNFRVLPDYCHSIEAAWEIAEKFPSITEQQANSSYRAGAIFEFGIEYNVDDWTAGWKTYDMFVVECTHKNIAMAICLAFLKLP